MVKLIFGLKVAAIGIGIVFAALVFLIFVIYLMAKMVGSLEVKKTSSKPGKPVEKKEVVSQSVPVTAEDDSEVVAVISAAVAYMTQGTMRIATIRRIKEEYVPAWSAAGRQETMNLRQL